MRPLLAGLRDDTLPSRNLDFVVVPLCLAQCQVLWWRQEEKCDRHPFLLAAERRQGLSLMGPLLCPRLPAAQGLARGNYPLNIC